jgi:Icc-related predicted phosphoesterase
VLAFSDLHRDRDQARVLVRRSRDADVVIGAGDFASMRLGLERTIEVLSGIETPTLLVPGNNETDAALWRACADWPAATILHGSGKQLDGTHFFGLGGGVPPTPFPWSYDLREEEAASKLADCPPGAVLVVHSPPRGYLDQAFGRHLGSVAILEAIERTQGRLAVCGHIHQAWGQEAQIGATKVVNLGPQGRFFEL